MDEVKVISVIYCTKKRKGNGCVNDPIRIIPEIYSLEGELIMDYDSQVKYTKLDMISFAANCMLKKLNPAEEIDNFQQDE